MKKGFTLSEVMLVLSVIGVIAALTIPGMIQNLQDRQYKVAYKKMYSSLSQATSQMVADNGGTLKGLYSTNLVDAYGNYLGYLRKCAPSETYGNCWAKQGEFKYLNNSIIVGWGNEPGIILRDGTYLFIGNDPGSCNHAFGTLFECATAFVDVNGVKMPNKMGKDIFLIHIFEDSIKPVGIQGDGIDPDSTCVESTGSGYGCGYKYLMGN